MNDASRTLPKALFWGVALNAVLGYFAIFTLCFTIKDPEAILSGATGYPFIQLFYNVTQSYAGTNVMVAIIIITLVAAGESGALIISGDARALTLQYCSYCRDCHSFASNLVFCSRQWITFLTLSPPGESPLRTHKLSG